MHRCTARSSSRESPSIRGSPSAPPEAPVAAATGGLVLAAPLTTVAFIQANYSIRLRWYMLPDHEHADRPAAPLGRNRPRKSDRNAVAQTRHRRAGDDRADLFEARLSRADALARERADDLHPAGRPQVPDRRRGDHG